MQDRKSEVNHFWQIPEIQPQELKYDGSSISLTYENGQLARAVTRGDGVKGDDVTTNVRTIKSIPLKLRGTGYPENFEIRGEVLMPFEEFNQLNARQEERGEPLLANPRNTAAGTEIRWLID